MCRLQMQQLLAALFISGKVEDHVTCLASLEECRFCLSHKISEGLVGQDLTAIPNHFQHMMNEQGHWLVSIETLL